MTVSELGAYKLKNTKITLAQAVALQRVFDRCRLTIDADGMMHNAENDPGRDLSGDLSFEEFMSNTATGGDVVMVPWCGMHLGIEPDGYCHS